MDADKIIEAITEELTTALDEIRKTKELDQKVQLSLVIRNLSESLSIFSSTPCSGFQATDINEDDELELNNALNDTFK